MKEFLPGQRIQIPCCHSNCCGQTHTHTHKKRGIQGRKNKWWSDENWLVKDSIQIQQWDQYSTNRLTYLCSAHAAFNLSEGSMLQDAPLGFGQACENYVGVVWKAAKPLSGWLLFLAAVVLHVNVLFCWKLFQIKPQWQVQVYYPQGAKLQATVTVALSAWRDKCFTYVVLLSYHMKQQFWGDVGISWHLIWLLNTYSNVRHQNKWWSH